MQAAVDSAILQKIKKLHALSRSSNVNEAAVAAAKMSELLLRHNLDMEAVEAKVRDAEDRYDTFRAKAPDADKSRASAWIVGLASAIAQHNFARILTSGDLHTKDGITILWIGRRSNVEVCTYMLDVVARDLVDACERARESLDEWERKYGTHWKRWKASFYKGAVREVHRRLAEMRAGQTATPTGAATTALIRRTDAELEAVVKEFFPKVATRYRTGGGGDASGYAAGQRAGRNVSLAPGLSSGGGRKQLTG